MIKQIGFQEREDNSCWVSIDVMLKGYKDRIKAEDTLNISSSGVKCEEVLRQLEYAIKRVKEFME